jgi:hypothetical protein
MPPSEGTVEAIRGTLIQYCKVEKSNRIAATDACAS